MKKTTRLLILLLMMLVAVPAGSLAASAASVKCPTLKAVTNKSTGVKITWKKISGAEKYYVYRVKEGNSTFKKIATVSGDAAGSYIDTTAKSGSTYSYTVAACKNGKKSAYDATGLKITYLQTPTVTATAKTSSIKLSWDRSKNASGYKVYRKVDGSYKLIASTSKASNTSYTDKNLSVGTYKYKVIAYNSDYESSAVAVSCKIKSSSKSSTTTTTEAAETESTVTPVIETLSTSKYYAISADMSLSGSGNGYHSKIVIGSADAAVSFGIQYDKYAGSPYTDKTAFLLENVLSSTNQQYSRFSYDGSDYASLNTTYTLTLAVNKSSGAIKAYVNNVEVGSATNKSLANQDLYCWIEGSARQRGASVDASFTNIEVISNGTLTANPVVSYIQTADGISTNAKVDSKAKSIEIKGTLTSLASNLDWDSAPSSVNGYVRFY